MVKSNPFPDDLSLALNFALILVLSTSLTGDAGISVVVGSFFWLVGLFLVSLLFV